MTDPATEIEIDEQADAAYVRVAARSVERTEEIADGILLDFDADGELVGVEVLGLQGRVRGGDRNSYLNGLVAGLKLLPARSAAEEPWSPASQHVPISARQMRVRGVA